MAGKLDTKLSLEDTEATILVLGIEKIILWLLDEKLSAIQPFFQRYNLSQLGRLGY